MSSFLGQQLGNYRLEKEIARGGFGTVYLARHTLLTDRLVAIKVLHDVLLNAAEEREAFLQEARLLEQLKYPFILPLLDVGIQEQIPFLITEYAAQGSLRSRLKARSPHPLPLDDSLTMLSQIGQALQYAHQQVPAIIHDDLKPENILFNQRGEALLADFGIATILSTASLVFTRVTGTPAYMAPEQFRGHVSRESDQYSLGCIAYELFTGQRPFTAPEFVTTAPEFVATTPEFVATAPEFVALGFKHATEDPLPLTQHNPNLPKHVEEAVLRAMAKQREDRHADVTAFIDALQRAPVAQVFVSQEKLTQTKSSSSALLPPVSSGQEKEIEELRYGMVWANTILKRIKQKEVPSNWHVIKTSGLLIGWTIATSLFLALILGVSGFLIIAASIRGLYPFMPSDTVATRALMPAILLFFIGFFIGCSLWFITASTTRFILIPDGFIASNLLIIHIIRFRDVEHIRFDQDTHILAVTLSFSSNVHEVLIDKFFNESPHLIAQRVQEAYTSFQAKNTLS